MSDLIQSTKSSVFELLRPPAPTTTNNVNNNSDSDNICSRLRSRKRIAQQPRQPQRKKRRTACGGIMNLVQPEDEEEDTEVILNKADEIESLQVGNNRNFKMKKFEYMVSYILPIFQCFLLANDCYCSPANNKNTGKLAKRCISIMYSNFSVH